MRQAIGNRITMSKRDGELIVKITSRMEGWQEMALLGWLVVWTSMGIYVLYYLLFAGLAREQQFFFLTYLAFWGWFEYKVLYAYLFKRFGFELLRFRSGEFYLQRNLFGLGKVKRYLVENIQKFQKVEHSQKSFSASYNRSFWVVGNEQVHFRYLDQDIALGMHLSDEETSKLLNYLNQNFRKLNA